VLLKPRERMLRHLLKCAGLFEEMRCTGHDYQTFRTGKQSVGYSIHLDDRFVVSTDKQHCRRSNRRQIGFI